MTIGVAGIKWLPLGNTKLSRGMRVKHRIPSAPMRFVVVGVANTMVGLGTIYLLKWSGDLGNTVANAGGYSLGLARGKGRRNDRALLFLAPRPSPLGAANNLQSGHLDVSCTGASTKACTSADITP